MSNLLHGWCGRFAPNPPHYKNIVKNCLYCDKLLVLRNNRDIERRNYCSHHCRAKGAARTEAFRANRQATCAQCGAQFTARTFNHKYCSIACTSAAAEWAYKERNATPEGFFKRLIRSNHKRKGLSWKYLMKLYNDQQGRCAISGVKMTTIVNNGHVLTNVSIDRIDSTKEYERGNIQLLCHIVNVMKHNMTKEQLIEWCWQIIDHKEA